MTGDGHVTGDDHGETGGDHVEQAQGDCHDLSCHQHHDISAGHTLQQTGQIFSYIYTVINFDV